MKHLIVGVMALSLVLSFCTDTVKYVRAEEPPSYQVVMAEVTAYTASVDETDGSPDITASGSKAVTGVLACPRSLQFGTKVEIAGVIYTCQDRMNARYTGQNYDILVKTKQEAFNWGRQIISVKIYE